MNNGNEFNNVKYAQENLPYNQGNQEANQIRVSSEAPKSLDSLYRKDRLFGLETGNYNPAVVNAYMPSIPDSHINENLLSEDEIKQRILSNQRFPLNSEVNFYKVYKIKESNTISFGNTKKEKSENTEINSSFKHQMGFKEAKQESQILTQNYSKENILKSENKNLIKDSQNNIPIELKNSISPNIENAPDNAILSKKNSMDNISQGNSELTNIQLQKNASELDMFTENNQEYSVQSNHIHEIIFNPDGTVTKISSINEAKFCNEILKRENTKYLRENDLLRTFIPKIIEVGMKPERPFIKMADIAYGYKFCSYLIIKIGNQTYGPNDPEEIKNISSEIDSSSTTRKYGFRIIALTIKNNKGKFGIKITNQTKDYTRIKYHHIPELIKRFLCCNNCPEMNKEALNYFIEFLKNLISFFEKENKRIFINSDLIFVLSNIKNKYDAKMIDFQKVYECNQLNQKVDDGYINGLTNLLNIFIELSQIADDPQMLDLIGGHATNFKFNFDGTIEKKTTKNEANFIESIIQLNRSNKYYLESEILKKFLPNFQAVYEKDGKMYIKMENLCYGMKGPSILDIVIGTQTHGPDYPEIKRDFHKELDKNSTTSSLGLKITGYNIKDSKGNVSSKENRKRFSSEEIPLILEKFFKSNSSTKINPNALNYFLSECAEILNFFENISTRCFISMSILFVMSNIDNKFKLKLIDLAHVYPVEEFNMKRDEGSILGLRNLIKILSMLQKSL